MTQIIGRLTGDAEIKSLENGNEVVNFTIAINDDYKPKDGTQWVEQVTFVQCGYWLGTAIAAVLRKGAIVEAGGRLFATAYMKDNKPAGRTNLQVQHVKVIAYAKKDGQAEEVTETQELSFVSPEVSTATADIKSATVRKSKGKQRVVEAAETTDDLPF